LPLRNRVAPPIAPQLDGGCHLASMPGRGAGVGDHAGWSDPPDLIALLLDGAGAAEFGHVFVPSSSLRMHRDATADRLVAAS
jgi:hypothetical protein